jgi:hypothetical protein
MALVLVCHLSSTRMMSKFASADLNVRNIESNSLYIFLNELRSALERQEREAYVDIENTLKTASGITMFR